MAGLSDIIKRVSSASDAAKSSIAAGGTKEQAKQAAQRAAQQAVPVSFARNAVDNVAMPARQAVPIVQMAQTQSPDKNEQKEDEAKTSFVEQNKEKREKKEEQEPGIMDFLFPKAYADTGEELDGNASLIDTDLQGESDLMGGADLRGGSDLREGSDLKGLDQIIKTLSSASVSDSNLNNPSFYGLPNDMSKYAPGLSETSAQGMANYGINLPNTRGSLLPSSYADINKGALNKDQENLYGTLNEALFWGNGNTALLPNILTERLTNYGENIPVVTSPPKEETSSGAKNPKDNTVQPNQGRKKTQMAEYYDWLTTTDEGKRFAEMYEDYADANLGYSNLRASNNRDAWGYLLGLQGNEGINGWKNRYAFSGVDLTDEATALDNLMDYLYGDKAINAYNYMTTADNIALANDADAMAQAARYLANTYNFGPSPEWASQYGLDANDVAMLALARYIDKNGWGDLDYNDVNDALGLSGDTGIFKLVSDADYNSDAYSGSRNRESGARHYGNEAQIMNTLVPYQPMGLADQDITASLLNAYNNAHKQKLVLE